MIVSVQFHCQLQDAREPNTDEEIVATTRNMAAYLRSLATTRGRTPRTGCRAS
jgi:hypothetical protein